MPHESRLVFYPRYAAEIVAKSWRYWRVYREAKAIYRDVMRAADRWSYTDLSLTPPDEAEFDALDLYRATNGGEAAVARKRREDTRRAKFLATPADVSAP